LIQSAERHGLGCEVLKGLNTEIESLENSYLS